MGNLNNNNHVNIDNHLNVITVKYLYDEATQTEFLFDHSVKSMSAATVKNITVNLAQGGSFPGTAPLAPSDGPVNTNLFHYLYSATTIGARRRFDETFAAGVSLSYLSGIAHYDVGIGFSQGTYDSATDAIDFNIRGQAE